MPFARKLCCLILLLNLGAGCLRAEEGAASGYTYEDLVRTGYSFIVGQKPSCPDARNCESGQPGILGMARELSDSVQKLIQESGYKTCGTIPSAGQVQGKMSVEGSLVDAMVLFISPTHSTPRGWKQGSQTFHKAVKVKVTMSGVPAMIALQFRCDDKKNIFMAYQSSGGTQNPGVQRRINLYTGQTFDDQDIAEFYMTEVLTGSKAIKGADLIRLVVNPSTSIYQLWEVSTSWIDNHIVGTRLNIHGNLTTEKGSTRAFIRWIARTQGIAFDDLSRSEFVRDKSTIFADTSSHEFRAIACEGTPSQTHALQGCVDFSEKSFTRPASSAPCAGLIPSQPAPPVIDANGTFSLEYISSFLGLNSKIDTSLLN